MATQDVPEATMEDPYLTTTKQRSGIVLKFDIPPNAPFESILRKCQGYELSVDEAEAFRSGARKLISTGKTHAIFSSTPWHGYLGLASPSHSFSSCVG